MNIGIEVELHSNSYNLYDILREEGLSLREFKKIDGTNIGVKLSEEYYSSTIEYNITPFDLNKDTYDSVVDYLNGQIDRYGFELNNSAPAFVGTHIHIFDTNFLRVNKKKLLNYVLAFINKYRDEISYLGLRRIALAHQLWGNWSHNNKHEWIGIINSYGFLASVYDSTEEKPKYNPIIRSRASSTGKPESVEIRIIPNEFFFNGRARELFELIESGEIYNESITPKEFLSNICGLIKEKNREGRHWYTVNDLREEVRSREVFCTETPIEIDFDSVRFPPTEDRISGNFNPPRRTIDFSSIEKTLRIFSNTQYQFGHIFTNFQNVEYNIVKASKIDGDFGLLRSTEVAVIPDFSISDKEAILISEITSCKYIYGLRDGFIYNTENWDRLINLISF